MSTIADAPAARAGVLAGDILLAIDKSPLKGMRDLRRKLDGEAVGREVELTLIRGGELRSLRVKPEARRKS